MPTGILLQIPPRLVHFYPLHSTLPYHPLPAMLNTAQTAVMLGLADHDIPVLVRVGLLQPLGDPPPNAVKSFGTAQVLELAGETAILNKIRSTVYQYWRGKNTTKTPPCRSHNSHTRRIK